MSYQGQTQLDDVYNHRRMFCNHPYIYFLLQVTQLNLFRLILKFGECKACWAVNTYLVTVTGFKHNIGMLFFLSLTFLDIADKLETEKNSLLTTIIIFNNIFFWSFPVTRATFIMIRHKNMRTEIDWDKIRVPSLHLCPCYNTILTALSSYWFLFSALFIYTFLIPLAVRLHEPR